MTDSEVEPLKAFADELAALRIRSGATYKAITEISERQRRGHGLARSTVHQKLAGQTFPDWPFVKAFVGACVAYAGSAGRQLAAADIDIDSWRTKYKATEAALIDGRQHRGRA